MSDAIADAKRALRAELRERRQLLTNALSSFTDAERTELARLLNKLADNWQR